MGDLVQLAAANQTLREIIGFEYLVGIYAVHERTIVVAPEEFPHNAVTDLKINEPTVAVTFFQQFGTLATKVMVLGNKFSFRDASAISRAIADHCNNLVDIHAERLDNHLVFGTNHTLPHVKRVHFKFEAFLELSRIHRIYPALEQLSIELAPASTVTTFNPAVQEVCRLLPRIPKLRSLTLVGILSNELLGLINAHLPALAELSIVYDATAPASTDRVHFKNVRSFSVTMTAASGRKASNVLPVSFDELEALAIYTTDYALVPVRLIEDSDYLETFSLPWTRDKYGVDYVVELLMRKKYVEKVTLRYWMEQPAANTISLISSFRGVHEITFVLWDERSSALQRDILISVIPDEWRIRRLDVGRLFGCEAYYLAIVPAK